MRILIHMGDPYPNEGPNAKRMRTFYEQFRKCGHTVKVLAPYDAMNICESEDIIYCKTPPLKNKTALKRLLNQIVFGFKSVLGSVKAGKIDAVITTSPPALISPFGWMIAKLKGAKLVYDVRDIWPDVALEMGSFTEHSLYARVFAAVRDFMLRRADLITAVSPGKVGKLKRYAPEANVKLVMNGLDEEFLKNEDHPEIAAKYGMDDRFNIVYIGNLGWAQGLKQLLQIAERAKTVYRDAQFFLFGSGVEEDSLKAYAREHQLDQVFFPGRLPNEQMYTILKHAQVSFVSLVNENLKDSVPTKMFEALGAGCPVLLAASGDAADILNECRFGRVVRPNDSEGLWNAFREMKAEMPEIMKNQRHAERIILETYSRQRAAAVMENELKKLF